MSIMEKIKTGLRSWLNIQTAAKYSINIMEMADFELSAIMNRIWYRGDSNELDQLYAQCNSYADKYKFWASHSSPGMEIRKLHTGLPHLIVRILGSIVLADMNDFDFDDAGAKQLWNAIDEENHLRSLLEEVLKDVLVVGDGAFKVTFDTTLSQYPILEWYPGDQIELTYNRKRLQEVIFKTPYKAKGCQYVLCEHYGKGYIRNELYAGENMVPLDTLEQTKGLSDWTFDEGLMMAIPFRVYKSAKYEGRGGSIFDSKLDSFDAVDEAWSQWMDALRAGRAKTYIPESCIPRDPETGTFLQPNAFDNRFIASGDNMAEGGKNQISTEQPAIPHDSYLASYITALDLCLQGIISPSTLGIDTKKLDNAEAQREKEKTTLYTRNAIVEALQETLPQVVEACVNAWRLLNGQAMKPVEVDIPFGEYANPSFESQVETVSKGKIGGIMSIEASVEELYGDSRDEEWKAEEVARLKAEQGITELSEPEVSTEGVQIKDDEGQSDEPPVQDEQEGIPGTSQSSV